MRIIVVTGTGTGVGKTITTAALAACALRAGQRVAVVKPIQTGVLPGEPGDLAEIERLTGLTDLHEFARYPEPLAPATAARRAGVRVESVVKIADRVAALSDRDLVIVEGAGGVLVRLDAHGYTIVDLASQLNLDPVSYQTRGIPVRIVLVTSAGLGSLHDAAAATLALRAEDPEGIEDDDDAPPYCHVIGDWPAEPGLADLTNLRDLESYSRSPLGGVLPHAAGSLSRTAFADVAVASLAPVFHGAFDGEDFLSRHPEPAAPTKVSAR